MNVTDEIYHWDQIAPVNRWKRWINQLDPVYNLQSTDDNKKSTIYRYKKESTVNSLLPIDEARWNRSTAQDATIYKDAKRCSKMKWKACNRSTNGSTDQRVKGSTDQNR